MNRTIAEIVGVCLLLMSLIFIYAQRQVIAKLDASVALQTVAVAQLKLTADREIKAAQQSEHLNRAAYAAELKQVQTQPVLASNLACEDAARWALQQIQEKRS